MSGYLISNVTADCTGCGACRQACKLGAISFEEDSSGFAYPAVDRALCVKCGACMRACPVDNANLKPFPMVHGNCFGGFSKDHEIREESSSGGFFTGIVKSLWCQGCVVFGAVQMPDLSVAHTYAESFDDMGCYRKSKYAPSDTRQTYVEAKRFLDEGRRVIYSGTPCQIAGLKTFLGRDYEQLFTIDLVCHGYFAPLFFRKERDYYEQKFHSRAIGFDYRDKKNGTWTGHYVVWTFANGKRKKWFRFFAPYYRVWLKHLISRPSCFACRFAGAERVADITLGDYWHVEKTSALFGGNRGTSVVFGNSDKGKLVLEKLRESYVMQQLDRNEMTRHKLGMHGPIKANPRWREASEDLARLAYRSYLMKWARLGKRERLRYGQKWLQVVISRMFSKIGWGI